MVIAVGELAANTLIHTTGKGLLTSWVAAGDPDLSGQRLWSDR